MNMTFFFSIVVGIVLLFILCWNDFKDKIIRPRSNLQYFTAYALFMFINVVIYFTLLFVLSGHTISSESSNAAQNQIVLLQPVLIGLMYFGAGAAKFKIAGKEISLYQKVIDLFKALFKMDPLNIILLREQIRGENREYSKYEEAFKAMEIIALESRSNEAVNYWQDVNNDRLMIDDQIDELTQIHNRLTAESRGSDNIKQILSDIKKRIDELREKGIDKLLKFILDCLAKYVKSEKEREIIVKILISLPAAPQRTDVISRSFIITLLSGLSFGPIFAHYQDKNQIVYSWIGACAFSIFGLVFALFSTAKNKYRKYAQVLGGGLAGAVAFIVWEILTLGIEVIDRLQSVAERSIIGVEFGVVIAMLIYLLGPALGKQLKKSFFRYSAIGIAGSLSFFLVAVANANFSISTTHVAMLPLGMIVLIAMAFASDIFHHEEIGSGPR